MKLWDFALDYYRRDGVAAQCLALQDGAGVDVNVLIYLLWRIAIRGERVPQAALSEAETAVAAWRHEVVAPLRNVRRRLKTGPSPAPISATEALRGRIKAAEIEAEHIELNVLEALAGEMVEPTTTDLRGEAQNTLQDLIAHYGGSARPGLQEAVAALVRAL